MSNAGFDRWIAATLENTTLRTNSLIITVFGDAIAPHREAVWLGDLIELLAPLQIKDRAVRTSVFRLVQEGWLQATPVGRRSAYRLTNTGQRRVSHAYRRIYDAPQATWNGEWQIVALPEGALKTTDRDALRRDLRWDGYGSLAPNVFARPSADASEVSDTLRQSGSEDKVVVFRARELDAISTRPLQALAHECWRLDRLADDYRRFIARFAPAIKWLKPARGRNAAQHFLLRTLLIHEFRRVQLRDPQLPDALLDANWPGHTARQLCRDIYAQTLPLSEQHLATTMGTPNGALPQADTSLYRRFGGLPEESCDT